MSGRRFLASLSRAGSAVVLTVGCFRSVVKPGAHPPAQASKVGLKYAVATDVRAVTTSGDTVTLPRLQSVRGRLSERRGDTLIVALDRWPEGAVGVGPPPRAIVVRTPE